MVAHNKNYKPSSQAPTPSQPHKPKPRWAGPKDEVSPLCETDLICELANPANSLEGICAAQRISLETLSLWMARRDVAERLDLVQTTAMNRARFIGRLTLPTAAQSAANIINAHSLRVQKPTIDSAFNTELHRANENMLKAARFLERLTAEPAPPRAGRRVRNSEVPSPTTSVQEEVGEGDGEGRKEASEGAAPSSVHVEPESSTEPAAREPESFNPRDQSLPSNAPHKSNRRSHPNKRSKKPRPRKPQCPSTQPRITASSAPAPPISAAISPQPEQAAPRRAPQNAAPPHRAARATSPASRAPSG